MSYRKQLYNMIDNIIVKENKTLDGSVVGFKLLINDNVFATVNDKLEFKNFDYPVTDVINDLIIIREDGLPPFEVTIPYLKVLIQNYVADKSIKSITRCKDCKDEINEGKKYNNSIYCETCYSEQIKVCGICDKKEKSKREYLFIRVETDKYVVPMWACIDCSYLYAKCTSAGCSISTKESSCQKCGCISCKEHKEQHVCRIAEPTFLFRDFKHSIQYGDINKAIKIKSNRPVGVELEAVDGVPDKIINLDRRIGIAHDGSLKGSSPIEIQTPPASADELENLIKNGTNSLKNAKFEVNKSCGMHIHFDSGDFYGKPKQIVRILKTYYAVEPVIFAMLPASRRNNAYSQPLRNWLNDIKINQLSENQSREDIEVYWYKTRSYDQVRSFKNRKWDSSRYHGLNLHALFMNGHIEMRYHHGTLNATKIINWINLHMAILEWALGKYNHKIINAIGLVDDVQQKFRLMYRHFSINKETRRYVLNNIEKFKDINLTE